MNGPLHFSNIFYRRTERIYGSRNKIDGTVLYEFIVDCGTIIIDHPDKNFKNIRIQKVAVQKCWVIFYKNNK